MPLHISSSKCSSSGVPNCINTSSGITHSGECVIPDDVLIQFRPPNDEHLLLETCRGINKYIKKECIKMVITQKNIVEFIRNNGCIIALVRCAKHHDRIAETELEI
jgi:hypothetical protein